MLQTSMSRDFLLLTLWLSFIQFLIWTAKLNSAASLAGLATVTEVDVIPFDLSLNFMTLDLYEAKAYCVKTSKYDDLQMGCNFLLHLTYFLTTKNSIDPILRETKLLLDSGVRCMPYSRRKPLTNDGAGKVDGNELKMPLWVPNVTTMQEVTVMTQLNIYRLYTFRPKQLFTSMLVSRKLRADAGNTNSKFVHYHNSKMMTMFSMSLGRIDCESIQSYSECFGNFLCDEHGKLKCQNDFYGARCQRKCISSETYECDSSGNIKCRVHYYNRKCTTFCKKTFLPSTSYECSAKGEKICSKGFFKHDGDCLSECDHKGMCLNGGFCRHEYINDMACTCLQGWTGNRCQYRTCRSSTCKNGGTCLIVDGTTKCLCLNQTFGERCQYEFVSCTETGVQKCQNFGECVTDLSLNMTGCVCRSGYYGHHCQHQITFGTQDIEKSEEDMHSFDNIWLGVGISLCSVYTALILWFCTPGLLRRCETARK